MHLSTPIRKLAGSALPLIILLAAWLPIAGHAAGEGAISGDVGEAILKELKEIRKVLEKIEKQKPAGRPSRPTTGKISTKGKPTLGAADAPVTVVEFTDYQCPYCLRFARTSYPILKKKYLDTGKVRWVAMNLPLSFHKDARKAAQGAMCAGEQDRFWEMREKLYSHQKALAPKNLLDYAASLGMDGEAFDACLRSDRYLAQIDKDAKEARALSLTGTPSFIIGKTTDDVIAGRVVIGAQPVNVFEAAIDKELAGKK